MWKCAWSWPWPLDSAKVKYKYTKESPYVTCYLMAIVIFTQPVTILKTFIVEIYMPLTRTFTKDRGQGKYNKQKPIYDLLFDGNSNFLRISQHFQDIHWRNVHDLDLDLWNGPRSNVVTSIESPYMICYLVTIVISILFVTISKIFVV